MNKHNDSFGCNDIVHFIAIWFSRYGIPIRKNLRVSEHYVQFLEPTIDVILYKVLFFALSYPFFLLSEGQASSYQMKEEWVSSTICTLGSLLSF